MGIPKKWIAIGLGVVLVGAIGFAAVSASSGTRNGEHRTTAWAESGGRGHGRDGIQRQADCDGHGQEEAQRPENGEGYGHGRHDDGDVGHSAEGSQEEHQWHGKGNDARGRGHGRNGSGMGNRPADAHSVPADQWVTVSGKVVDLSDNELTLQTDKGQIEIGLGPVWYWDEHGIEMKPGDEVSVSGFYSDDEFEPGKIVDSTTGASVVLRTDAGTPLWAGGGSR